MRAHAICPASASNRWTKCTPSARLEEKLRDRFGEGSSPFAEEGTKAHSLAELKLLREKGKMGDADGINEFNYTERRKTLGDIPDEMDEATDAYVDIVMEKFILARSASPDAKLMVEQRLDFSEWVPHGFGTGDVVIVSDILLEVCDLKYGKGVRVEAPGNSQARCYGLGAMALFGELYTFPKIRNTIIQPRLDHVSEETLTREELLAWASEVLVPAAELAWKGEGEFVPGEHCRFCLARAICYARALKAFEVLKDGMETPGVLPDSEIPRILEVADVIEDWIGDLKKYAQSQALKGQRWPGFKLVRGKKPPRSWKNEEEVRDQLIRAGYDETTYEEHKLKSVSKIEKAIGKQAFRAMFESLVYQGDGALTLVPVSDKRPEVSSAEADFSDLIE
jgi:hypothetical protein